MQVPSINIIGGTLAVAALGTWLYFGVKQVGPCPAPIPTVSTVAPAPVPRVLKPPVPSKLHRVYRKPVSKVDCNGVPPAARQVKDKEQVLAAAAQYGLSPAQVSALRVCLN